MEKIDELLGKSAGAQFYRADLHIHSHGGSHDVKDASMTPSNIVKLAVNNNISLVSITDHNSIKNVGALLSESADADIVAIPGVELSTQEGHLLVYFEAIDSIQNFMGSLSLGKDAAGNTYCKTAMLACLELAERLQGFGILAHVDLPDGFEKRLPGFPPTKIDILCHRALLGIEVKAIPCDISYTPEDAEAGRKQAGNERVRRLKQGMRHRLARVLNSDAHTLGALGRNAIGHERITRYKMQTASFNALRLALQDGEARVRIEDEIPQTIPHIAAVEFEGGLLRSQQMRLSRNLTCFIGGRGSGKSTTLEAIRCVGEADEEGPASVVDSEVWPDELTMVWSDEAGRHIHLQRAKGQPVENLTDGSDGATSFPLEFFGQGDTGSLREVAKRDPLALLRHFDRYIHIHERQSLDKKLSEQLKKNAGEVKSLRAQRLEVGARLKKLQASKAQLDAMRREHVEDLIQETKKLSSHRQFREGVRKDFDELGQYLSLTTAVTRLNEMIAMQSQWQTIDPTMLEVSQAIVGELESLRELVQQSQEQLVEAARTHRLKIDAEFNSFIVDDRAQKAIVDAKRKELGEKNIIVDASLLSRLAVDESLIPAGESALRKLDEEIALSEKHRRGLLQRRQECLGGIHTARVGWATELGQKLSDLIKDPIIKIKYVDGVLSPEAEDIIQKAMGWRTSQVPRAHLIVMQLGVKGVLQAIAKGDAASFLEVVEPPPSKTLSSVFSKTDADEILAKLSQVDVIAALEACAVCDLPRVTVTKQSEREARSIVRSFEKLSLGQQHSVLLAVLLSSDGNHPIVIDQPEDNLDSEFIYHTLVPVLRYAKERRQVIVVSHNANICVLGDAEQIFVLKSVGDRSSIAASGSVDDDKLRGEACRVLEGAEEAFRQRARIYGLA